jgi:hypothetical protein
MDNANDFLLGSNVSSTYCKVNNNNQDLFTPPSSYFNQNSLALTKIPSAVGDSGSTEFLLIREDEQSLLHNISGQGGKEINVANGQEIFSINSGKFKVDEEIIMDAHVFNNHDLPRSLLGFAPLANQHDCTITLTKDALTILNKHGKQIIHQTNLEVPHCGQ